MVPNRDNWIRIFDIPETSRHKNGFTIYKVVSMLYPESCPDAITKVTVWKRFNDFKKLNREIKALQRKLDLNNKCPSLPSASLFKRFDEQTILERKQSILAFLEYVGNNPQLFMSSAFVKFFESSHTPADQLSSNINLIRADLNLPEDPEYCINSDDDHTISDTDSITTLSSLSPSVQFVDAESLPSGNSKLKKLNSLTSIVSKTSDNLSISDMTLLDGQLYPTPPNTPGSSNSNNENIQYLIDATVHINLAEELENDKKYDEAFTAYKAAIDILLKYGKDDTNYERKRMVKYKTEKYMIRAEKIYNMYLAPEMRDLHLNVESNEITQTKRPLFHLYKFKVVKIIGNGMLVIHSDSQQMFFIKVIHKSMQFLNENIILPEDVPYMVKLQNHYNCDRALFLVLEYCSGFKLRDYLKHQHNNDDVFTSQNDNKDNLQKPLQYLSDDNESDCSYSDLVNDYASHKKNFLLDVQQPPTEVNDEERRKNGKDLSTSSDDSFVKVGVVNENDILSDNVSHCKKLMNEPLLHSAKDLLVAGNEMEAAETSSHNSSNNKVCKRKFSDMSASFDEEFDTSFLANERDVVKWAAQLLIALEKLHTLGVICRDLEMKNLLIDDKGDLRLTYMCNAKDLSDLFSHEVNINLAPEVYSFQAVTEAVDWWSFGAILYELLVGMPLSEVHPNGVTSFTHLKIPKFVSLEGRSILRQLLTYEPHDRLGTGLNGTENIKSHPFFSCVVWEQV